MNRLSEAKNKMAATKTSKAKQDDSVFFENQRFYSVKQASERLNVTEAAVRNWIYRGQITAHKVAGKISLTGANLNSMISVAYEREA